ncbi:MAG: FCD domain-containing protein [Hydrogenophaga sp.]|jgi:DNA-binding FadR family transcriptional regulator|uniref:FadR/GntR family transcriptional regulator n=1 Tax=Hydrogenophaga sp. TaxID=1904254 RepID=UPI002721D01B|nr:FCD domain-containing protein [Hydrogenophaga sp.]MDO9200951.1 FCD domain-containing protein [Hydrogenophaga sp.]MDO9484020.1 FCD domain-containing protein [Hydrogenophaga sp.]MDP1894449.1 FCD domain-containing protein [Hydrogenophaga sp.]MDP2095473.1 FCD domain-containing protein [Hydrogenophaga sp.]MDP2222720.1 FCD domain-containing protein [Hydrogenophaga sp.]
MDIEKLQLQPAYRVVSDDLRQRIVRGEVLQGDAIPTEGELAASYGVHRSTIREGLRQLEQDGLLRREGKKLVVSIPRHSDLANAAERALRMHQVTFRDVWEVASSLEPLCAQLAAERITPDELAAVARNLERTAATVAAGQSAVTSTIEFQALVAEATHNQALQLARAPVSQLMRAGYAAIAPALPQSGERLLEAHRHVLDALQRHDAEAAVQWTRKHLVDYRRGCEYAGLDLDAPIPLGV